jgi:hypothetical protein
VRIALLFHGQRYRNMVSVESSARQSFDLL